MISLHTHHAFHWMWSCLGRKAFWLKANRLLAWALVVSPLLQWYGGTPLIAGVLMDLAVVVVHGVLSLVLLGRPRVPAPGLSPTHWSLGMLPRTAGLRARFLMSGWKVMLGLIYLGLPWLAGSALDLRIGIATSIFFILWFVLWGIRLQLNVLGHLATAARYAVLRWRLVRESDEAMGWGICLAAVFVCAHVVNLFGSVAAR